MTYTRTIQIRLSRDQHERIKADSINQGFDSVSNYIRYLALAKERVLEAKIVEIHQQLCGANPKKRFKVSKYHPFINT